MKADPTQTAFQTVSQRFIKRVAKLQTMQSKQNDSHSGFENKAVKKVFYKPLHLEINYQTLHIIYLFAPQQLYFPVALPLQHISRVFQSLILPLRPWEEFNMFHETFFYTYWQ